MVLIGFDFILDQTAGEAESSSSASASTACPTEDDVVENDESDE